MNPDELPEREWVQLSYGDHHYRFTLHGPETCRYSRKYEITLNVQKALHQFHVQLAESARRESMLRTLLMQLAALHPDMAHDPKYINFLTNGGTD